MGIEPFRTIEQAAGELGIPYWKLQRAVKAGRVPSYALQTKRRLVKISEVVARMRSEAAGDAR